jgi:hypothetical protein
MLADPVGQASCLPQVTDDEIGDVFSDSCPHAPDIKTTEIAKACISQLGKVAVNR